MPRSSSSFIHATLLPSFGVRSQAEPQSDGAIFSWLQCQWTLADLEKLSFACGLRLCVCVRNEPQSSRNCFSLGFLLSNQGLTLSLRSDPIIAWFQLLFRSLRPLRKHENRLVYEVSTSFRTFQRSLRSTPHSSSCGTLTEWCEQMCPVQPWNLALTPRCFKNHLSQADQPTVLMRAFWLDSEGRQRFIMLNRQ